MAELLDNMASESSEEEEDAVPKKSSEKLVQNLKILKKKSLTVGFIFFYLIQKNNPYII